MAIKHELDIDINVLANISKNLSANGCKVWLLLVSASGNKAKVPTSLNDLKNRSEGETKALAITTIQRGLEELVTAGLLMIQHNVGKQTQYTLLIPESYRK